MVAFPGRIEAKLVVPSGGASVSATVANGGSAATVTVPAASYFMTAAGGVSGLLATLETALNGNHSLMGFPRTADALEAALGYGDFTNGSGWLCQEASGDLAPVFGAVTLADSGTPTYQNDGIKDGDYAVGFDAGTERFDGGDVLDVTDTQDLAVAAVVYVSAAPTGSADFLVSKIGSSGAGWQIWLASDGSGQMRFQGFDSGASLLFNASVVMPLATWCVVIACVDRGTGKARIAVRTLAGVSTVSSEQAIAATSMANAVAFRLGDRSDNPGGAPQDTKISALYAVSGASVATGLSANLSTALSNFAAAINAAWSVSLDSDGRVAIGWSGYSTPTHSLSWTSTALRDALGFDADISGATTSTTGANQSPACWLPDSPLNIDGHPAMAPEETDTRTSESPTGVVLGLSGNTKYAHSNLRYRRVPVDRIREASATYSNASLEVFLRNTQFGQGSLSWFSTASPVQVYWNNAGTLTLLGDDANDGAGVAGWTIVGISNFSQAVRLSQDGFVGQFDVTFPRLVSSG